DERASAYSRSVNLLCTLPKVPFATWQGWLNSYLIDWFIRNHPDRQVIEDSKIQDGYERINIWKINPSTNSKHPAAFPTELAEKVIRYYSFLGACEC
ncbi:MAG TPA: hypothetical protein PLH19_04940, partial [Anaerolineae bacterium]|nr:hypothetical protein [Anaerolineae bacterium]HQH37870.1 hypothetical protein [Anaerolineae bacterium]